MQTTAKDLRFHSKELLEAVARGEEVIITYRGKPCAKLVPIDNAMKHDISKNPLFGIWRDNAEVENVNEYMDRLRRGRIE
jgi:prevent-host-death family protein